MLDHSIIRSKRPGCLVDVVDGVWRASDRPTQLAPSLPPGAEQVCSLRGQRLPRCGALGDAPGPVQGAWQLRDFLSTWPAMSNLCDSMLNHTSDCPQPLTSFHPATGPNCVLGSRPASLQNDFRYVDQWPLIDVYQRCPTSDYSGEQGTELFTRAAAAVCWHRWWQSCGAQHAAQHAGLPPLGFNMLPKPRSQGCPPTPCLTLCRTTRP